VRVREHKCKEEQIGDFLIQEDFGGKFHVFGEGKGPAIKVYKTLRSARLYCLRSQEGLSLGDRLRAMGR
jgi:hypothetical protein